MAEDNIINLFGGAANSGSVEVEEEITVEKAMEKMPIKDIGPFLAMGIAEDGMLYMTSTTHDLGDLLVLLEQVKFYIMNRHNSDD